MSNNNEILKKYVLDIQADTRHSLEAFEMQYEHDIVQHDTEVEELMDDIITIFETHRDHLARLSKFLENETTVFTKEAISVASENVLARHDKLRPQPASKMLRDNCATLAFTSGSYEMLHTLALAVGNSAVADYAQKHFQDLVPFEMRIRKIIPRIILRELKKGGLDVQENAEQQVVQHTHKTWSFAIAGSGG